MRAADRGNLRPPSGERADTLAHRSFGRGVIAPETGETSGDPHNQLAEVFALQQAEECGGRIVQTLDDIFPVF